MAKLTKEQIEKAYDEESISKRLVFIELYKFRASLEDGIAMAKVLENATSISESGKLGAKAVAEFAGGMLEIIDSIGGTVLYYGHEDVVVAEEGVAVEPVKGAN